MFRFRSLDLYWLYSICMLYPRQHVVEPKSNPVILVHGYVLAFLSRIMYSAFHLGFYCWILTNMYCTDCTDIKEKIKSLITIHCMVPKQFQIIGYRPLLTSCCVATWTMVKALGWQIWLIIGCLSCWWSCLAIWAMRLKQSMLHD